jgi:hypothetical protein
MARLFSPPQKCVNELKGHRIRFKQIAKNPFVEISYRMMEKIGIGG